MAYMNKEMKAIITLAIKPILKKYGVKATLSVDNHSTINLNIRSSKFDFIGIYNTELRDKAERLSGATFYPRECLTLTEGWVDSSYAGIELQFFNEAFRALRSAGYYNNSDAMIDYFDTAYYYYIKVGQWDKPYIQTV